MQQRRAATHSRQPLLICVLVGVGLLFSPSLSAEEGRDSVRSSQRIQGSPLTMSHLGEKTGDLMFAPGQQLGESTGSTTHGGGHSGEGGLGEPQDRDTVSTGVYTEPGTALFVELLGKPYPSVNVDLRIHKSSRLSLGIMSYFEKGDEDEGEDDVHSFVPTLMYYLLDGRNSKFERGLGLGLVPIWHEDVEGFPLAFYAVIGYRYQRKNGLLFRIGANPCLYPGSVFLPWISIGLGYSL